MHFISKKVSLVILGITAIVCSKVLFLFFNDPEGPNLLVVTVMTAIVYVLSLAVYFYYPSTKRDTSQPLPPVSVTSLERLLLVIFVQILIIIGFFFWLR